MKNFLFACLSISLFLTVNVSLFLSRSYICCRSCCVGSTWIDPQPGYSWPTLRWYSDIQRLMNNIICNKLTKFQMADIIQHILTHSEEELNKPRTESWGTPGFRGSVNWEAGNEEQCLQIRQCLTVNEWKWMGSLWMQITEVTSAPDTSTTGKEQIVEEPQWYPLLETWKEDSLLFNIKAYKHCNLIQ